uniref:Partner of Y14 and mago n=1 Tax=Parascaris univalens TaxID=6257 RepID=A0A915CDP5_PARUN
MVFMLGIGNFRFYDNYRSHRRMAAKNVVGDVRIKTKSGETFIAASQRADGTWRKARRVKEGYVPQEEQPRYESPAAQVSRDSKYPIGMTPKETTPHKARTRPTKPTVAFEKPNAPITPRDHMEKKIGNLNRKLRDIDILQKKIASGELANPEKTQLEKIARKEAIELEIEKLTAEMERL